MKQLATLLKGGTTLVMFAALTISNSAVAAGQPATQPGQAMLNIPEHAVAVAPGLYHLGTAFDAASGRTVEGYMIVRPYREPARPSGGSGGGKKGSATSACYDYIVDGAKWRSVEPWVVNPNNPYSIADSSVFGILNTAIAQWEDATDGRLNGKATADVVGAGSMTFAQLVADSSAPDSQNEVYFGNLPVGTIGVTTVWGYFGGPLDTREIVEWDQVYNTYYPWSDTGATSTMDFANIATHELGHTMGLGDLYTASCSSMTMYGYSAYGDIHERDLADGDINGMNKLY